MNVEKLNVQIGVETNGLDEANKGITDFEKNAKKASNALDALKQNTKEIGNSLSEIQRNDLSNIFDKNKIAASFVQAMKFSKNQLNDIYGDIGSSIFQGINISALSADVQKVVDELAKVKASRLELSSFAGHGDFSVMEKGLVNYQKDLENFLKNIHLPKIELPQSIADFKPELDNLFDSLTNQAERVRASLSDAFDGAGVDNLISRLQELKSYLESIEEIRETNPSFGYEPENWVRC